jgi:hypothetical protein
MKKHFTEFDELFTPRLVEIYELQDSDFKESVSLSEFVSAWAGLFVNGKVTLTGDPEFEVSEDINDMVTEAFMDVAKEF